MFVMVKTKVKMFKKIVSNLPFHPAVLEQVGFYLHRLKQEDSIRRAGLVLTALVIALQVFVIVSPSKPSLATSTNDIVYGAKSKEQVLQAYNNNRDNLNRTDIQAIFNYFGIGSAQIAAATYDRIGSQQKRFVSTGRGTSPGVDTFINIPGVQNGGIYQRLLSSWDTSGHENWYDSITGISSYGFRFWILTSGCGNIVFEENALTPNLNIVKKLTSSGTMLIDDIATYSIQFQNTGPGTAKNVTISDTLANEFNYVSYTSNVDLTFSRSGQSLTWKIANTNSELPPSTRWFNIDITAKLIRSNNDKKVCNASSISASGVSPKQTSPVCISITAQIFCRQLRVIENPAWDSRKFETTIDAQTGAEVKQINYFVNDNKVASVAYSASGKQLYTHRFPSVGEYRVRVELEAKSGSVQPTQSCQVVVQVTKPEQPEPRISTDKTVENLTQNVSNADGMLARPGDKLKYTIIITNSGDAEYKNLKLEGDFGESINDILEYSNLIDQGDARYNKDTNFLSWDAVNIPAGETIRKSFIVQVMNPLPATPVSASDPLSYDFKMQNEYGRLVTINLDKPVTKVIEQTAKELPNTGPGTSIAISAIAAVIIGYFFYRGRLLSRELEVVHHSYSAGGL